MFRIVPGKTMAPFHALVGAGGSPPLCCRIEQTRNDLKAEFRVRAMAAVPSSGSNPYQAPAEAIDFAEVSEDETNSKTAPRTRTVEALRETRPWVSLLGWLGLLASGLMLLGSGFGIVSALLGATGGELLLWLIVKFAMSAAYCTGAILLLRYASGISDLLVSGHGDLLDAAIEAQKSFWRFAGMTVSIALILICGGIIFVAIAGGASFFLR